MAIRPPPPRAGETKQTQARPLQLAAHKLHPVSAPASAPDGVGRLRPPVDFEDDPDLIVLQGIRARRGTAHDRGRRRLAHQAVTQRCGLLHDDAGQQPCDYRNSYSPSFTPA
jgi:hypothetical protein